jgi:hypothetical protein
MTMATKRKRKTKSLIQKGKLLQKQQARKAKKLGITEGSMRQWKVKVIERIKKHKLRFDIDYEKGIYDLTPKEADIYDDSIDDILRIIRKM